MPASTYQDYLKLTNAQLRENPANIQAQQVAKINEVQQYLTWQGQTASAWDYPTGTVIVNASTAVARSTVFDFGRDNNHKMVMVRIVSTVGATPSATLAIQGSKDSSTWANVNYYDYLDPSTPSSSNLTITTATTTMKLVPSAQNFRFLSVNVSADTNVTLTIDVSYLG